VPKPPQRITNTIQAPFLSFPHALAVTTHNEPV
jgi:hypothetical protein